METELAETFDITGLRVRTLYSYGNQVARAQRPGLLSGKIGDPESACISPLPTTALSLWRIPIPAILDASGEDR